MSLQSAISASAPYSYWKLHSVDGAEVPTYHRYWRVYVTAVSGGALSCSCAELELHNSIGGANLIGSGTLASSSQASTFSGTNAIDGNASTYWMSSGVAPAWLSYDFGSGTSYAIDEISWTARNDASANQSPSAFLVQFADDNVNWVTWWQISDTSAWSLGQKKTWSLVSGTGTNALGIADYGTANPNHPLVFNQVTGANFNILTGSATASNVMWDPRVPQSGGFYQNTNSANYAIINQRTHDYDFMNPFDLVNISASAAFSIEFMIKYPQTINSNSSSAKVFQWGGYDTNLEAIEIGFGNGSVSGWPTAQNLCLVWSYFSASTMKYYEYYWASSAWQLYNIADGRWHHVIVSTFLQPWPGAPGAYAMIDGVAATAGGAGTWPTQVPPTSSWYRNYSGGTRIGIGNDGAPTTQLTNGQALISEVAIYNRAMDADEAFSHWVALQSIMATGTLFSVDPLYSIQTAARDTVVASTGSGGGKDARASKANPGTN